MRDFEHQWIRDDSGKIDELALYAIAETMDHSGPKCSVCEFGFCDGCNDPKVIMDPEVYPCPGPPPEGKHWFWDVDHHGVPDKEPDGVL